MRIRKRLTSFQNPLAKPVIQSNCPRKRPNCAVFHYSIVEMPPMLPPEWRRLPALPSDKSYAQADGRPMVQARIGKHPRRLSTTDAHP